MLVVLHLFTATSTSCDDVCVSPKNRVYLECAGPHHCGHALTFWYCVMQMVYGAYDWELAAHVKSALNSLPPAALRGAPHQGLFLASDEQHPHPRPLRPLPTLPLAEMNLGQLSVALSHLVAAAIVLGRAIAWPALPCPEYHRLAEEQEFAPWFHEGRWWATSGAVPYPTSDQPIGAHTAEPDREVDRQLRGKVDLTKQVCLWYEYMWVVGGLRVLGLVWVSCMWTPQLC